MNMHSSRRTLLKCGAALLAAPAIVLSPRKADAAVTLTLGHGAAPGNPRSVAAETFAKLVHERTGGNVSVKIAGSEQLGNDVSMLTSLRTGALDLTANSQGAASGLVPEIAALGLPFLFQDSASTFKVLDGPTGDELAGKFNAVGMILLAWWDNGTRHITNSKRPIRMPADLNGLKIRTPADPMTVDIFQALGASTQQIAFGELYVALQQGVVDGQENPLANIASSKLHEVNKFITLSGHKWESTPFLMSQIAARKVKPGQLDIIKAAAREAGALQRKLMVETDSKLLAAYKTDANVAVNECDRAAFRSATAGVVDKWKAKPFGEFVAKLTAAAKV
jgi:tripartite ATP-independent transporter DctP family solute receptor